MKNELPVIGILGAGKLGIVLAQLLTKAGYEVIMAGSGDPSRIALSVKVLAPLATVTSKESAAREADIVILALPLGKFKTIPKEPLEGKLVIDAMNYWWEVDGNRPDLSAPGVSTTEIIQAYLENSRVVKAFNHVGYHDLFDHPFLKGNSNRRAIALAGDSDADIDETAKLIEAAGFDPLPIGNLEKGKLLQPGQPAFGVSTSIEKLRALIAKPTK